jgi:hypothetical protein
LPIEQDIFMAKAKNIPPVEELTAPEVVNLVNAQAEHVDAELVRVSHSRVSRMRAEEIDVTRSGVIGLSGDTVSGRDSWIGAVQGGQVTLNNGGVVVLQAEQMTLNGNAGFIQTNQLEMAEGSTVGVLAARKVSAEKVRTILLLAGKVEGPVETTLDTRRILLASLVAGIATGGMLLLGRFLFRRRNR